MLTKNQLIKELQKVIKEFRLDNCTCYDCYGCCSACDYISEIEDILDKEKERNNEKHTLNDNDYH